MNYKMNSNYNTLYEKNKPFLVGGINYGNQIPNPTLQYSIYDNKTLIAKPKMSKFKKEPSNNRSSSTPSNQNKYPIRKKKNENKMPFDRNIKIERSNKKKGPQDKTDKKKRQKIIKHIKKRKVIKLKNITSMTAKQKHHP